MLNVWGSIWKFLHSALDFRCMIIFYSIIRNLNKLTIILGFCMVFKPNLFIFKRLVDQIFYDNSIEFFSCFFFLVVVESCEQSFRVFSKHTIAQIVFFFSGFIPFLLLSNPLHIRTLFNTISFSIRLIYFQKFSQRMKYIFEIRILLYTNILHDVQLNSLRIKW